jgi:ribosomal-protein-serine acetyltransferase
MFSRTITDEISISLAVPQHAEAIFSLTDRNRDYLRRWLPWLDGTKAASDTKQFLEQQLLRFARGEALLVSIFCRRAVAGVAGFNSIDRVNRIGFIGYWLGEEFTGKGIMTRVVGELIGIGKGFYSLQRIEIRCAAENVRSRAIPERLGFTHEGTLRRAEKLYDRWNDLEVYAMLLQSNSEPGRSANRSQPVGPGTNQTPTAAGSGG